MIFLRSTLFQIDVFNQGRTIGGNCGSVVLLLYIFWSFVVESELLLLSTLESHMGERY